MNMWRNLFSAIALAFVLCLTGLVMTGEAQAQRFVDNGNGTVTDTVTGLMWTKNANQIGVMNWHNAMARCDSFSISGIGGWRLPSKDELADIYLAMKGYVRGRGPFNGVSTGFYWSSSIYTDTMAWGVFMYNGGIRHGDKTLLASVWPVRASQ